MSRGVVKGAAVITLAAVLLTGCETAAGGRGVPCEDVIAIWAKVECPGSGVSDRPPSPPVRG